MDAYKVNLYLDYAIETLNVHDLATTEHILGSLYLQTFVDELFGISFIEDCLVKGIGCQRRYLQGNIIRLAKTSSADKIFSEFASLYDNADVLYIAVYEKLLYFLAQCCSAFLRENTRFLYDSKSRIDFSYTELVKGIEKSTMLDTVINLKICKSKTFELVTNSEHWIKTLKSLGVDINENEECFFKVVHFRRNAASHYHLKDEWFDLKTKICHKSTMYWLYGIALFAMKVDACLFKDVSSKTTIQLNLHERGRYKFGVWCAEP
jgi:hypothetical protein